VKPETQNQRLKLTGVAKPGEIRRLTGTGLGLAHQESAGQVFGWVWNRTDPFWRTKSGLLARYPDPLLALVASIDFDLLCNVNESMVTYCNFVIISKVNDY